MMLFKVTKVALTFSMALSFSVALCGAWLWGLAWLAS